MVHLYLIGLIERVVKMISKMKVGFIGAGNMAQMIIARLCQSVYCDTPENIYFYNPTVEKRMHLKERYQITALESSKEIYETCDIVVFAVKPQMFQSVCSDLGDVFEAKVKKPLVLSIMAGVNLEKLEHAILHNRIVRIMPNTSAAIGKSMTTLSERGHLSEEDRKNTEAVFSAIGEILWVEEKYLDITSAINGTSPAFLYLIAEALADGAVRNGLTRNLAENLIAETFIGVGMMLKESEKSSFALKNEVSSPGGMTMRGLEVLEAHHLRYTLIEALTKAKEHSERLGKEA